MIDISYVNEGLKNDKTGFIKKEEERYFKNISKIGEDILKKHSSIVLLSGPSSSGKTTTALRLGEYLKSINVKTSVVSLDDFYLDREDVPLNAEGYRDLETINSLDIKKIHENLSELLKKGSSDFPVFNFLKERRSKEIRKILHDDDHVLIVEGIHALNPMITDFKGNENHSILKVYISVEDGVVDSKNQSITNNEVRFIRRMIRDFHYRDAPVKQTFGMWTAVRKGEKIYIDPFIKNADHKINTTLSYAPGIFKKYLNFFVKNTDSDYKNFQRLVFYSEVYNGFETVSHKDIPEKSLLHEFLWEDIAKNKTIWYNELE